MNHLREETLGLYAIDPAFVSAADVAHLEACAECQRALADVRTFDDALRDPEAWQGLTDDAAPADVEELRAFAVRAAEEDAAAAALLDDFKEPSAAGRFVWANVARKPEYQTGGVARLLCKWANGMCERDPQYALKLAEAATAIATALRDESYPRGTIHEIRGESHKERANALLALGDFQGAAAAIDAAEEEYLKLPHANFGLASVMYVRGSIYHEQEELDAAERCLAEAADIARGLGDTDRVMRARCLLAQALYERCAYGPAAEISEEIVRYGHDTGSAFWLAHGAQVAGACYLQLGKFEQSERYLHEALRRFTELTYGPEVTRTRWSIARLLFARGDTHDAINDLRRCIAELTDAGIVVDAGLAAIDLAEILHATGRVRDIPLVLENVVRIFISAGKLTGALTALAYLKEVAAGGTITPRHIVHVRRFVQRVERRPELIFAPPTEPL